MVFTINIALLYGDAVVHLGPTVRARLTRAFALDERLTLAERRPVAK